MEAPTNQTSYLSFYNKVLPKEVFTYLTKEQELDFIIKAQNGDKKAVERLIMANFGYIVNFAKSRQHSGTTLEDLIDVSMMGFCSAIMKFNTDSGYRLITFAHYHLLNAFKTDFNTLVKGVEDNNIASINTKVNSDNGSSELGDFFAIDESETPEAVFERKNFKKCLRKSVNLFPEKERKVAELAFGFVKPKKVTTHINKYGDVVENRITYESIGEELGLTKQRVQQLFANVKALLHNENEEGKYVAGYLAA